MHALAKLLRPLMTRIFPDVPAEHPPWGSMIMNMAANMLGLANAATPLGLRAMQDLEKLNPRPGTATNAMCTFLALNTSSVQLIPASAVAILAAAGSVQPTAIIGTGPHRHIAPPRSDSSRHIARETAILQVASSHCGRTIGQRREDADQPDTLTGPAPDPLVGARAFSSPFSACSFSTLSGKQRARLRW